MKIIIPLTIIVLSIGYFLYSKKSPGDNSISAQLLRAKLNPDSNIGLIDVRTKNEYNGSLGHVQGSISIPLSELNNNIKEIKSKNFEEIYVICLSGSRSASAVKTLIDNEIEAYNVKGGMLAWNKSK